MSVIKDLICTEEDGTLSFGNYELAEKAKRSDYEHEGDLYKVKTFAEITKLEKNGMFVYESVPGTAVNEFRQNEKETSFKVEGDNDAQITLEMEEGAEYEVSVNGDYAGKMKTNIGGKLVLSVDLQEGNATTVVITKA